MAFRARALPADGHVTRLIRAPRAHDAAGRRVVFLMLGAIHWWYPESYFCGH